MSNAATCTYTEAIDNERPTTVVLENLILRTKGSTTSKFRRARRLLEGHRILADRFEPD